MKKRYALAALALLLCALSARPTRAQDEGPPRGPFWLYARIEVNTTRQTADGEKHEFRVYVSNLVSVTPDVWTNLLSTRTTKNVEDYFDATVVKAAKDAGLEIEYYDQDIEWDCTCTGTSNEVRPKSDVEKNRDEVIQTAKDNGHPVLFFNWDPTGKNKEQDLQSEQKRNAPPSNKPTAPTKKPGT